MLIPIKDLIKKYNLDISGLIHVGAHEAQELEAYTECAITPVWWIEGDPVVFERLVRKLKYRFDNPAVRALISDSVKTVTFNRANMDQSSSYLELGTHAQQHPEVKYVASDEMITTTLDNLAEKYTKMYGCNFLNIDIQGAELDALKGAEKLLDNINYIYLEINKEELYKGCPLYTDLDEYLTDFTLVEYVFTPFGWGDGFWIRK